MPETPFQRLSADGRRDALANAEKAGNHQADLLEKDIWVVATLRALFAAPFAEDLIFKGGTSLSKAWRVLRRFSEDIDITYDIRAIASDLVSASGSEALPPTRSQERVWTRAIRARLGKWIREQASPIVEESLADAGFQARFQVEGDRLLIAYEPLFEVTEFVRPLVVVEFGARSTGEPHDRVPVVCDAAALLPDLVFPEATTTVLLAERTFWEKATAMHVFCHRERGRGTRLSRHWHDLVRLDEAGVADRALNDRALALSVARHKAIFFIEKDSRGERISYEAAVSGGLQLVPTGAARALLADDHAAMVASGMLLGQNESFDALMERCGEIEAKANAAAAGHP